MVDSYRVPADLAGWDPDADLGQPGEFPFTRGIQPTMYRGRLWTMRQYSGFGTADGVESALSAPARAGGNRTERRVRPAHADGLRLGPCPGCRRGGPRGRCHRFARRHGGAVRRHPARSRVDVDDDQLDRDHPARDVRRDRRPARHRSRASCPAQYRTTSSRSIWRAARSSIRRRRRSAW